jgi:hypothetical protein
MNETIRLQTEHTETKHINRYVLENVVSSAAVWIEQTERASFHYCARDTACAFYPEYPLWLL